MMTNTPRNHAEEIAQARALHETRTLDNVIRRTSDYAEHRAACERAKMMADMDRYGPWVAAVILFAVMAWVIGVYVNWTVAEAVSQIGRGL